MAVEEIAPPAGFAAGAPRLLGRALTDGELARLAAYARLLLAWNRRINLTGARSADELYGEHFPDALVLARLFPAAGPGALSPRPPFAVGGAHPAAPARSAAGPRAVDVGAGGGLPALPFAILRPDVALTLIEPRKKRAAFLRAGARELDLPSVTVIEARLGDDARLAPPPQARGGPAARFPPEPGFDLAISRATFEPAAWLALAPRLCRPGGLVAVFATAPVPLSRVRALIAAAAYPTAGGAPRWLGLCST